jgi:tRNA pseudouridine38-40 synthase
MKAEWAPVNPQLSTISPQPSALSPQPLALKWQFTITADRFLRNMVRAIVGTLLDVGRGVLTIEQFREIIEKKDRCSAGMSVPGHALFLADITYPDNLFDL